ncbi:trans-2-enoyl-CoA reductase [Photobacterium aquae]|uniref:Enoyl-[acyl-carrier-protein] reductase [NADH] n=1 Tax=Photobacterium aquae TaxID=1195763 RepID=A0A0J1HD48_9GAMM|nr:enoyl-ACP reductase FabV [Photobacterium aquae]KLV09558.1 trans-2-enoyl-CoA reductase [Photobacterium aquae]
MVIEPIINGVIARSAHPYGCQQAVRNQIDYVKKAAPIINGPKRVLILGASSGFGLASRIALTFGGSDADTLGVSFERGPSDKGIGTAGWYNNIFFRQEAERAGRIATNIVGDAFSPAVRRQVIDAIQADLGGQVDLVVYSLATGVRPKPEATNTAPDMWRSVIKTLGQPVTGPTLNLERDTMEMLTVGTASEQEAAETVKVMGGEDWTDWIACLADAGVLAPGCRTVAYSYVGSPLTYPIYHQGTLGQAKKHLHHSADEINQRLADIGGQAHVAVCKALVTKASVFIPAFAPYILALFKVMKAKGCHEGCIEQMQRMFATKFYPDNAVETDGERLIRMDDWELAQDVQREVAELMVQINENNFAELGDYAGYKQDFLQLNGFAYDEVDYSQPVSVNILTKMQP